MQERITRLLAAISDLDAQAALLHSTENIRYFSGYTGEGCALISANHCVILTDSRYTEQAARQAPAFQVIESGQDKYETIIAGLLNDCGIRAVAFEDEHLSVSQYKVYIKALEGIALVALSSLCVRLRAIKDASELAYLKKASQITDAVFQYAMTIARPGISEIDLSTELKYHMAKEHQAAPSFEFIVASGANGSMPHAIPTGKALEAGDMVTLDFGAEYCGYKADMTRTFALGTPSEKMREIYEIVRTAQQRAAEALKPGAVCRAVDAIARGYIGERGYGGNFGHGLGHGVGLLVHEEPRLNARSDTVLEPGMAVTVEPGIYLPGIGGVRIEDTCIITQSGWESLFVSDKRLIIL